MGSHLSYEMDDEFNNQFIIGIDNSDFSFQSDSDDYQEGLVNILQQMVGSTIRRQNSSRMPIIKKKPDLSKFINTKLYREIKTQSGALTPDNNSLAKILQHRENGLGKSKPYGTLSDNEHRKIFNLFIPNQKEQRLMSLEHKVFVGKFNKDGSRLITASQDHIIRIFDSSKGTYHRINRITAQDVSWCILDIDYSPCNQNFVYSTWSNYVFSVPMDCSSSDDIQWFNINPDNNRTSIFSIRYSPSGSFLVGGSNYSCIHIFDIGAESRTKKIKTDEHEHKDINAVSFLDDNPNIFVSGCDEGVVKLWDLRCVTSNTKADPLAIFLGHFDGITYIDSRNDGRYFLTNSKDQSIKIFDLRRTSPKEKEVNIRYVNYNWDYRWDNAPREYYNPQSQLDGDCSVMTYRGHRVTKSLIRARFSPAFTTGQRFIYTGCGTGRVIIYDVLSGQIKETIEGHRDIVRDVSWHPTRSEIVSCSWDTHVNLNTFKRNDQLKRRNTNTSSDHERPLRRSRRLALRNQQEE